MLRRVRVVPFAAAAMTAAVAGVALSLGVAACSDPVPQIAGPTAVASAAVSTTTAAVATAGTSAPVRRVVCRRVDGEIADCSVKTVER